VPDAALDETEETLLDLDANLDENEESEKPLAKSACNLPLNWGRFSRSSAVVVCHTVYHFVSSAGHCRLLPNVDILA
jgi:hypothetical protein